MYYYLKENDIKPQVETFAGRIARLKEFRNWFDCDVEFPSDGTVLQHVNYGCYHFGNVKHPDDSCEFKFYRVGERVEIKGQTLCIVDWIGGHDVTFMFEDGRVVPHKDAKELKRGCFGIQWKSQFDREEYQRCRIGESFGNKKGEIGTISKIWPMIARVGLCYVDVDYEKGGRTVTVPHVRYHDLEAGNVFCYTDAEEQLAAQLPVFLPKTMDTFDGHHYEIEHIYGLKLDVLVDNVLVREVTVDEYLYGKIKLFRPWRTGQSHLGETAESVRHQTMQIIVWRSVWDIDVLVDGEMAAHREYANFRARRIISDRASEELRLERAAKRAAKNKASIPSEQAV